MGSRGRSRAYDLAVLGGGPAGLAAASEAAAHGARVVLVERDRLGGGSLQVGSVPSKAILRSTRLLADLRESAHFGVVSARAPSDDFAAVVQRMRHLQARIARGISEEALRQAGVEIRMGEARFAGRDVIEIEGDRLRFARALIATGSRPDIAQIPGLTECDFLTNENVFDLHELPRRILVIGGGPLGCELAQALCRLGARTTIAQALPLFLPKEERDAAQILSEALARDGIEVRLNTRAVSVRTLGTEKHVELESDDYRNTICVDRILTGTGRRPNVERLGLEAAGVSLDAEGAVGVDDFLQTSNPRIYAAGDVCLEHRYTHSADASARLAVANALRGGRRRVSRLVIPWCTFTDPEIATVGLSVREARARSVPVKTFTVPMHDIDRAVLDGEDLGFVKIHVKEGTDRILGATLVGRHAGDLINEISLAMVARVGLRSLARVIHPYPTHAEAIQRAGAACAAAERARPSRRRSTHGDRHDRPGPHGRQHGAAAAARRPRRHRVRP
jgi:pyruvate/2-oxoglutarate dehydrogenase complex dihydrolipoamide dehydrogenase (E3) component